MTCGFVCACAGLESAYKPYLIIQINSVLCIDAVHLAHYQVSWVMSDLSSVFLSRQKENRKEPS